MSLNRQVCGIRAGYPTSLEDAYHDLLEPSGLRNLSLTSGNGGNAQNLALGHGNTRAQTVQHAPAPAAHSYSGHASNETFRGQPTPQYASTSSSGVRSSAFSPSRLAAPQPSRALPQPTSKSHFHDPGDGYRVKVDRKSPYLYLHDAGIDAINSINEQSILRSKEFGGILYRDPDKGTYGYTGPVIGKKGGFDYSRPEVRLRPGTEFAGTFHTHGSHSRLSKTNAIIKTDKSHDEFASDNFSRQDILNNLRRASTEHDHSRLYGGAVPASPLSPFLGRRAGRFACTTRRQQRRRRLLREIQRRVKSWPAMAAMSFFNVQNSSR
jgi:uncharacterized protein DUF4329